MLQSYRQPSYSLDEEAGTMPSRRRLISSNWHQEVSKLKEDATKKLNHIEQVCNGLEDLETTYGSHFRNCDISVDITDESKCVATNKRKLSRKNLYFSVCGGTSAGKSTLVNTLLGEVLLPSSSNRCTPCCVLIQATDEADSYFVIDDQETHHPIAELNEVADTLYARRQINYSKITVFVSKRDYEFFDKTQAKISLMDTPGSDQDAFKTAEKMIMGSDVFVFVVDAVGGFNIELKNFFQRVVKEYSLRKFLIVFNKWDLAYQDGIERTKIVEKSYEEEAIKFFNDLGIAENVQDNIFFLSSVHVNLLRQCDRYNKVKECIGDAIPTAMTSKHSVFVCGGIGVGRSTVINTLLDRDIMPTDASGTPSFISFERNTADSLRSWVDVIHNEGGEKVEVDLDQLKDLGNDRAGPKRAVSAYLARELWNEHSSSILKDLDIRLYDTPHPTSEQFGKDAERLMSDGNFTLLIVISARRAYQDNRQTIINSLKPLRNLRIDTHKPAIFLIVNKWDNAIDTQQGVRLEELKSSYTTLFIECCEEFQQVDECKKRIFFTSSSDYKRKIESYRAFMKFNVKLLRTGTETFKETKFEPIFQALETCSHHLCEKADQLQTSISKHIDNLEQIREIVYELNSLPQAHDDYLTIKAKSPVAMFLKFKHENSEIPDTNEDLNAIVRSFIDYCDDKMYQHEVMAMRDELFRQCQSEEQKQNLMFLCERVHPFPLQFSSSGISFDENRGERVVRVNSFLKRMATGWDTIDESVIRNGSVFGIVLGGIITAGGLVNPQTSTTERVAKTCIGVAIGAAVGIVTNGIRHCLLPLSKHRRKKALEELLNEYYCEWHRHVSNKTQLELLQYHLRLLQSLEQANQQLKGNIERFKRRIKRSVEERAECFN